MAVDLVLFACPGLPAPEVVRAYEEALEGCELRWIDKPGRSAVFSQIALDARGPDGRILPWLVQRYAGTKLEHWASISLVTYSAGYGLARELFRVPADLEALFGYAAIDSIHAGLVGGVPHAPQLAPFAAFARIARTWRKLFALGHTDVQTPQTGAQAFASTTQCAEALINTVGTPEGGWVVRSYDLADDAHQMREHGKALTEWGPLFVGGLLGGWLRAWQDFRAGAPVGQEGGWPSGGRASTPPASESPVLAPSVGTLAGSGLGVVKPVWQDPALPMGERTVAWSMHQLVLDVHEEPPGSNTGPQIAGYLKPCERGGKLLGLTSAAWCAAGACAAMAASLLHGEVAPHQYRCSGLELVQDAVAAGTWRPVGSGYLPRVGDIGIYRRTSQSDPHGAWQRHVVRVESAPSPAGAWRSIGGNEGDRWALTNRWVTDADLLGFIEYPRG